MLPAVASRWRALEFDSDLLKSFQYGLVLGVCVLSALVLFPGREDNSDPESSKQQSLSDDTQKNCHEEEAGADAGGKTLDEQEAQLVRHLLKQRRGRGEGSWTPHQRMNYAVYLVLIGITIVVLLISYDGDENFLRLWLVHHFPREASALGFT